MTNRGSFSYVNFSYLEELAEGEEEFLREVVRTFLEVTPDNLDALKAAVAAGDREQTAFYAHKLKGSFNFIGCSQLSATFSTIETWAKETGSKGDIAAHMQGVDELSALIIAELETIIAPANG